MGVREILAACGRRWYVLVLGLLLTAGGGWYVYHSTPADDTAGSLVLLLPPPPPATGEQAGSNPFLDLSGLELTARVLVASYSGTAFQDEIARRFPTAEVTVAIDESTQGGVVSVQVKDRGVESTMALLDYVTGTVSDRLASLQSEVGVKGEDAVKTMLLAKDTTAKPDYQSLIRLLVLVLGGGAVATLLLALLLDVILVRRGRRGSSLYPERGSRKRRIRRPRQEDEPASEVADAPTDPPAEDKAAALSRTHPATAHRAVPEWPPTQRRDPRS